MSLLTNTASGMKMSAAGSIQSGGSSAAALADGYRFGFAVGAGIVVAALILAACGLRSGHRGGL